MSRYDDLLYGERIDDVVPALKALFDAGSIDEDGMFAYSVELPPAVGGPLCRAMMRAEAELLLEDAEALRFGTYEDRTPEQRAADALVRLVDTMAARP
jgi:hypothetical protein